MIDNIDKVKNIEKLLYYSTLILGVINLFNLVGNMNVEIISLTLWISIILIILGTVGVFRYKSNISIEKIYDLIFNISYINISLGTTGLLLYLSPRLLEQKPALVGIVVSLGSLLLGITVLARQYKITKRWI